MNIIEAEEVIRAFYNKSNPSDEDEFIFVESLKYIIENTDNPRYMVSLGGFYYGKREFDLALKYYEAAAEKEYDDAYVCLGYVWYYGRTGKRDYEKAFRYFSLSAEKGNIQSAYKIADMYKNGYFVEKDYEKYKSIIKSLYPKVKNARYLNDPLPEILTRLARIYVEEGNKSGAIDLYYRAKEFLEQRISYNDFFGDLNIMKWLIDDLYELVEFNRYVFDFYDMYYLLQSPCEISFSRGKERYMVNVTLEDGELAIEFNGKWYRSREDFFAKATLGEKKLTSIYDQLYGFEVK